MDQQHEHPEFANLPDAAACAAASSLRNLARFDASMNVSPQQRARLEALMVQPEPSLAERAVAAAREVARLIFDSAREAQGGLALAGYRSASAPESRLMQFACEDGVIDLRVELIPHSDRVMIMGEASAALGCTRVEARRWGDPGTIAAFDIAEDGYFEVCLPKAECVLEFARRSGRRAMIERLDLSEGATER
jgi:hypothetical protein